MVRGWWDCDRIDQIAGLPKLIIAEAGNFPDLAKFYYDEVILRAHSMFRRVLQRRHRQRRIPRDRRRPHGARALAPCDAFGVGHSFACCEQKQLQQERYLDAYLDMLLHGLLKAQAQEKRHARREKLNAGGWRPAALPLPSSPPILVTHDYSVASAQPASAPVIEFAASELVQPQMRELRLAISITGTLAPRKLGPTVKAKVAGELKTILVREGGEREQGPGASARIDTQDAQARLDEKMPTSSRPRGQLALADKNRATTWRC